MEEAGYLFDNAGSETPTRFAGLQNLWDSSTMRYLAALGVRAGWRCWEVGAGGGSIATWLADQVGPSGHVLATDLDVTWIPSPDIANITIARHDVVRDPIPEGEYDLVHARLVLVHIPEREAVLRSLAASLRPGGHLLIEDFDAVLQDGWEALSPEDQVFRRGRAALHELLRRSGADVRYARQLPQLLRALGLEQVSAEGRFVAGAAARGAADAMRANFLQTRDELIGQGLISAEDLDRAMTLMDDADFPLLPLLVSAWGRRPD